MGVNWQRARTEDQIEERERQILEAAGELFSEMDYEAVTMQKIAARAGFTRSNLYRYYSTREEIFLTLYLSDGHAWADEVCRILTVKTRRKELIDTWLDVLMNHERFCRLTSLLALSLEKNSSMDMYRKAKLTMAGIVPKLGRAVGTARPRLSEEDAFTFVMAAQMLIAGVWPMSRRSSEQEAVLDELNIEEMKINFRPTMRVLLLNILRGLEG